MLNDDAPDPLTIAQAGRIVGAVSAYAKAAAAAEKNAREIIARDYLTEGDRITIRDPRDGTKLGTVSVSEPKAVAEVDDEEALLDYIEHQHPEAMSTVRSVRDDPAARRVLQLVLAQHAPSLLNPPRRVAADWARAEVLGKAAASGDPIPGVSIRTKRGHATVRPAPGSLEKYRELVASGVVDPLRELPVAAPATEDGETA